MKVERRHGCQFAALGLIDRVGLAPHDHGQLHYRVSRYKREIVWGYNWPFMTDSVFSCFESVI